MSELNHGLSSDLPVIVLPADPNVIPAELREMRQWVCWYFVREEPTEKNPHPKPRKVPLIAGTLTHASTTSRVQWRPFDVAWNAANASNGSMGVGFVFTADDPFCGVDLDDCVDEEGNLTPEAKALVERFVTYSEVSPSDKGVKMILKGRKPPSAKASASKVMGCGKVEIFDDKRYFTVTGQALKGWTREIAECQEQLNELCDELWPSKLAKESEQTWIQPVSNTSPPSDFSHIPMDKRESRCMGYLEVCPDAISGQGGHNATLRAACECFRFGLDDAAVWRVMAWFNANKTGGEPWTEKELQHKIDSARSKVESEGEVGNRLTARDSSQSGEWIDNAAQCVTDQPAESLEPDDSSFESNPLCIPLGQADPDTGRLVLSPQRTLPTANVYLRTFHAHRDGWTLRYYGGLLMQWQDNRYCQVEDTLLKHRLQPWLHRALRYEKTRSGGLVLTDFQSNPSTVKHALETIQSRVHLPATTRTPSWLNPAYSKYPALELLPCKSMTLHIPSGEVVEPTPALFNTNALEFDYDMHAPQPVRWLAFLNQLFGDDVEAIELLQEWFGYCLTGDTRQQKMLLLVGPKRSGKGTIGRVLTQLVGAGNVVGPTTGSLAGTFGLQPLIDKSLAIVSDARFSGENVATVVERLLCISGEDTLSIDRKFLGSVSMKLATRFMFLTNELPRLSDASNALAGRFLILKLRNSFYGKEDPGLSETLLKELPGILLWAIEGWKRLQQRGRFVAPTSSEEAVRDLEDLGSPVSAFLRERCVVGAGHRVPVDVLYREWQSWCSSEGRSIVTTKQTFGRDLIAAEPGIECRRGTHLRFYEGVALRGE